MAPQLRLRGFPLLTAPINHAGREKGETALQIMRSGRDKLSKMMQVTGRST
jgi:hypothetical protein